MLKGIPYILSPDLLKVLMEMGHTDEIVIADGNFPVKAHPRRVVRLDGHGTFEVLGAILRFFPLDRYVENPVILMRNLPCDPVPAIWKDYKEALEKYEPGTDMLPIDKCDFYDRSRCAYAVVTTSESSLYANIILKKGVVAPEK